METLRDGIVPFLICVAFYSVCLWGPRSERFWRKWKDARGWLENLRRLELRLSPPTERMRENLCSAVFRAAEEPFFVLGFEELGEFVLMGGTEESVQQPSAPLPSPHTASTSTKLNYNSADICRVLVHREQGCVATIFAPVSYKAFEEATRFDCRVASWSDEWIYTSYASDAPLGVWSFTGHDLFSCHGKISVSQLVETHFAQRAKVADAAQIVWNAAPITVEDVIHWENVRYHWMLEWAKHQSPWSVLKLNRQANRQIHPEWLGELSGKLPSP